MTQTIRREPLTKAQAEILRWIGGYLAEHLRPPTIREVQAKFDLASTNAVICHITPLRKKGYLEASAAGRSRGFIPAGLPRQEIAKLIRSHVARLIEGTDTEG